MKEVAVDVVAPDETVAAVAADTAVVVVHTAVAAVSAAHVAVADEIYLYLFGYIVRC